MKGMHSKAIIVAVTLAAAVGLLGIGLISPGASHGQPTDGLPTDIHMGVPSLDGLFPTPVAEPEPPTEPPLPPQTPVEPPPQFEQGPAPVAAGPAAELPAAGTGGLLDPDPVDLAVAGLAVIGFALIAAGAITRTVALPWRVR